VATVLQVSDPYANFMRNPPPARHAVCRVCSTFCTGWSQCSSCSDMPTQLSTVVPITFSVGMSQMHTELAGYERSPAREVHHPLRIGLTAVLWRFLEAHEGCVAGAAGVDTFPAVCTVPSSSRQRDEIHQLRTIVGEWMRPTAGRHERLLRRTEKPVHDHVYDAEKFAAARRLDGDPVLLIDDTWTRGANAQSAAAALKQAGAGPVGLVVIGRHINPNFRDNEERLAQLPRLFDWDRCCREV
jgi:predicted amidophosphoribosyltransferase